MRPGCTRLAMVAVLFALLAPAGGALAAGKPLVVKLKAPGHTPKVKIRWHYSVTAKRAGKPVAGKLTVQIVDPIGGVHPVEFGTSTKKIIRFPFKGTFKDFIIWPPESRGIPVTLRLTVIVGKAKKVIKYPVTPRG